MSTAEARLRRALEGRGDERILTLDPAFSGLPDTAHGGSVLAVFDAIAARAGGRAVRAVYRRRVPLGVPLRLTVAADGDRRTYRLAETSGTLLVEGRAGPAQDGRGASAPPAPSPAYPVPVSATCFACGVSNPIGLGLRLGFDDHAVTGRWQPREPFRAADGSLAPVALTTMLDEAAFWLGALASGESGMTTDLEVTLHGSVPFATVLTIAGRRDTVRRAADDPRYWTTEAAAWDDAGRPVADARITFVAVRGAGRKLAAWLSQVNPPDTIGRIFPTYATPPSVSS